MSFNWRALLAWGKLRLAHWILQDTEWVPTLRIVQQTMGLNAYAQLCHQASVRNGWWHDLDTGAPLERNHGEQFMLMVSELSEAMEGVRKDLMDDKLPHRKMVETEMADSLIRHFDYAGKHQLDLDGAMHEKLAYNAIREDHKPENRRKSNGKRF